MLNATYCFLKIIKHMNYIDATLCIPLIWGTYKGFVKGLISEAASFIAFGLAVYGSLHFSDIVATVISEWFEWESDYLQIIAFATTFLSIVIVVSIAARIIHKLAEGMALGGINKIGGALFGGLKFALMISLVIFVIDAIEKSYPMVSFETKNESLLYEPVGMLAPTIIPGLRNSNVISLFPDAEDFDVRVELKDKNKKKDGK